MSIAVVTGTKLSKRGIGIGVLERGNLSVAIGAVRGDDHPRAGIGDAIGQSLVGKAAEDRSVDHPPNRLAASVQ